MSQKNNARSRIMNYLMNGYDITVNQARSRFGIQNVSARVYDLREEGWPIYTNQKTINGRPTFVYRLGRFPRSVASIPANTSRGKRARRQALVSAVTGA
jgi:predicted ArsR family transcriptional regulator